MKTSRYIFPNLHVHQMKTTNASMQVLLRIFFE